MDANALHMMVIPVVAGLGLGSALGTASLIFLRSVDAIAGRAHAPPATPRARRGRPLEKLPAADEAWAGPSLRA